VTLSSHSDSCKKADVTVVTDRSFPPLSLAACANVEFTGEIPHEVIIPYRRLYSLPAQAHESFNTEQIIVPP
jgi:hypothetical protein